MFRTRNIQNVASYSKYHVLTQIK